MWNVLEPVSGGLHWEGSTGRDPLGGIHWAWRQTTGFTSCSRASRLFASLMSEFVSWGKGCSSVFRQCLHSCSQRRLRQKVQIWLPVSETTSRPAPRSPWRTVPSAWRQSRAPWMWTWTAMMDLFWTSTWWVSSVILGSPTHRGGSWRLHFKAWIPKVLHQREDLIQHFAVWAALSAGWTLIWLIWWKNEVFTAITDNTLKWINWCISAKWSGEFGPIKCSKVSWSKSWHMIGLILSWIAHNKVCRFTIIHLVSPASRSIYKFVGVQYAPFIILTCFMFFFDNFFEFFYVYFYINKTCWYYFLSFFPCSE